MKDNTNIKALGKFKDEMNSLIIKEFLALSPKVYSIIHQHVDDKNEYHENYNKKTLKGVSKVVVKKEIKHENYVQVLETSVPIKKDVVRITSKNHQLQTITNNKTTLTNFYDKQVMLDSINCVPFGYRKP